MSTQSTLGDGFSDKKSEESTSQKRTHTQFAVTNPTETPFPTTSSSPFGELKNTNNYRDDDRARFDERPTKLTRKFSVDKDDEDEDEDGRGDFAGRPQPMDKSFYELLVTFSRLDATNTQETEAKEPCPLCLKEFSATKFATHVIDCVESKDGEERSKQIEEDAQLAQALQTSEDAEASSRRHSRKHHHRDRDRGRTKCRYGEACYETDPHHRKRFSHSPPKKRDGDEEMDSGWKDQGTWVKKTDFDLDQGSTKMGGTGEKVCRDERNCKRTDAQHFINLVHPKVSCPICDQPFEVYQVEAHVNLCLTAEAPPASVLEAFGESAKSFSTIRSPLDGDSDDGDLMGDGDKSKKKGGKKSTSPDQKQKQAQSPGAPLLQSRSLKPTTNLSRQQLVAMSTLLVNQQNKGAAQQDFSVRKLLESFKTLGFTKETLQSALDSSPSSSSSSSGSSSSSSTSSSSSIFDPFSTGSTTNFSSSSQSSLSSNSFFPTDFFSSTTSASFSFGSSFSTTPMFSFSSSSSTSSSTPSSTTTASYEFGLGSADDFETSSTFPSNQNTTWTNGHSNSSSGGGTGSASGSGGSSSSGSHPPRPRIKIRVKPKQTGQTSSSSNNSSQSTSTSSESGTSSENRDAFGSRSRSMP